MHPETEAVIPYLIGQVLEVGGGGNPTPGVHMNVDHTPAGELGVAGSQDGIPSRASIAADMGYLPFRKFAYDTIVARHVLEHHYDTLTVLKHWANVAKRVVIICPDQSQYAGNTIHLDPTHRAAFTPGQLAMLTRHAGYDTLVQLRPAVPQWSFLLVTERTVLLD